MYNSRFRDSPLALRTLTVMELGRVQRCARSALEHAVGKGLRF
jgi:hypothetical protein